MTIIVKQVYWYISQISGEHLQDHWSSSIYHMFENDSENEMQWSAGTILCCLATASDKRVSQF